MGAEEKRKKYRKGIAKRNRRVAAVSEYLQELHNPVFLMCFLRVLFENL